MTVTSDDVARLAGVSQATVSRALRGDTRVTAFTQQRVRNAAQALGYVRSELGRGLSTRATHRVALVAELENTLYHQLMRPIHDELGKRDYRTPSSRPPAWPRSAARCSAAASSPPTATTIAASAS